MNRLFGSKQPKASLNDATFSLETRISEIDVRLSKVNAELSTYQQKLNSMPASGAKTALKQRALKVLRKRKQLEAQKDQLDSQLWNISQAQMTTENLKNTMITVDAMKTTAKEMKRQYGKINIDKLEDLQDEMLDMVERGNEIQEALGRSYDLPDEISESELDAELEALDAELDMQELDSTTVPSYLQDTQEEIPQFVEDKPELIAE
ncbi:Vps60 protein [Martiniozyma asiatica (nom. inval.)]|nr:Vps60 protein [Martiniozyma asiatica]